VRIILWDQTSSNIQEIKNLLDSFPGIKLVIIDELSQHVFAPKELLIIDQEQHSKIEDKSVLNQAKVLGVSKDIDQETLREHQFSDDAFDFYLTLPVDQQLFQMAVLDNMDLDKKPEYLDNESNKTIQKTFTDIFGEAQEPIKTEQSYEEYFEEDGNAMSDDNENNDSSISLSLDDSTGADELDLTGSDDGIEEGSELSDDAGGIELSLDGGDDDLDLTGSDEGMDDSLDLSDDGDGGIDLGGGDADDGLSLEGSSGDDIDLSEDDATEVAMSLDGDDDGLSMDEGDDATEVAMSLDGDDDATEVAMSMDDEDDIKTVTTTQAPMNPEEEGGMDLDFGVDLGDDGDDSDVAEATQALEDSIADETTHTQIGDDEMFAVADDSGDTQQTDVEDVAVDLGGDDLTATELMSGDEGVDLSADDGGVEIGGDDDGLDFGIDDAGVEASADPEEGGTYEAKLAEIDAMMDVEEDETTRSITHVSTDIDTSLPPASADEELVAHNDPNEATVVTSVDAIEANVGMDEADDLGFDVGEDLVSHEETQVTEVDTSTAGLAGDSMAPVEEDLKQQHQEYVRYQEDELSRLGATIGALKDEREKLLEKVAQLEAEVENQKSNALTYKAELDEKNIELNLLRKRSNKHFEDLKYRFDLVSEQKDFIQEKFKQLEMDYENLRREKRVDVHRIREREKELEERLDLLRSDADVQIKNRDSKILHLKRKIDMLEFDLDTLQTQGKEVLTNKHNLEQKMDSVIQTLRTAITDLESKEQKRVLKKKRNLDA
jgi:hypothetical protein